MRMGAAAAAAVMGGAVLLAAPANAATPGGISVNPDVVWVDGFDGFGTGLAWGATEVGTWSDASRDDIADKLFSDSGLNLSIARYFVGSGQNPSPTAGCTPYRTGADPAGFAPSSTTWDWTADPGQRWFLDAARDRGVGLTEAVFSSPPYWMTVSGCTNGNADGSLSNVADADLDDYAAYIADVVKQFDTGYGMPFDTVAPMNEPDADWWDKDTANHSGTKLTVAQQSTLIEQLDAALTTRGLSTGISASDANHTQNAIAAFTGYSATAKAALAQLNTHTYHYISPQNDYTSLPVMRATADAAGKNLWMSEYGTGSHPYSARNTVAASLDLAASITRDLNELRPDGWVLWDGIESLRENRDSYAGAGTNWGLIYADYESAPATETYEVVKQYYAMAQYSRHLQPGMDIIATDDPGTVAGFDRASGKVVLVVANAGTSSKTVDYDLSHFDAPASTSLVYRTSDSLNAATVSNIALDGTELADTLPARSITTYVIDTAGRVDVPSRVVSDWSDKCVSISDWSTADGAAQIQWDCSTTSANQQWNLVPASGGAFQLRSEWSDKCLSITGASAADGATAEQVTCGSGSAQRWTLRPGPRNHDYLVNVNSGRCLSVADWSTANGGALVQWACGAGSANQLWRFL